MHILPPLETVKDIAATQQYDVLPLSCEILSDFITPIEAMCILKNVSTHCYMLESAQADDRWGRYTFLGFDPKLEITCIDGKMKAGGLTVRTDDPSQYLRELLSSYRSPRFDYLPSFTGGLVGYFSYDYLKYSEPSVRCGEQDEDSFKDVDLMLFGKVIAFDHVRQKIVLIVNMALSDIEVGYNKAKLELEQLVSLLKTGEKKQEAPGRLLGELENNKRGIYGGAIGYIDFTGNMDTCIAIRIAYKKNGRVFVRSGAGIVADSIPETEYQECINKAKAVVSALTLAQEEDL